MIALHLRLRSGRMRTARQLMADGKPTIFRKQMVCKVVFFFYIARIQRYRTVRLWPSFPTVEL